MASAERGAADAAQGIADALEAVGLPYAIGGALALAVAGVPRMNGYSTVVAADAAEHFLIQRNHRRATRARRDRGLARASPPRGVDPRAAGGVIRPRPC